MRWAKVKSPAEVVAGTMKLVGDLQYPRPGLESVARETEYMGQALLNPPSVEGWHTGAEWIDSGSLVRRINFTADAVSNISYPGVQAIIGRIRARGELSPADFVDSCLDLIGPLDMFEESRQELISLAGQAGGLRWDTEEASAGRSSR